MTHQIIYTCDQCGGMVSDLYGVLFVSIKSDVEPQVNAQLELCSFNCLEMYARRVPPKKINI